MSGKGPKFGTVRPGQRGKGARIDIRPVAPGWIYGLDGVGFADEKAAEAILNHIRVKIARGESPAAACAPFLPRDAAANRIHRQYEHWIRFKWSEVKAGDRSPRTVREYERYARKGGELTWWGERSVHAISYAELEDWSLWMAERGLAPRTRRHILGAFRAFCGWLEAREVLPQVPRFPAVSVPEHVPTIISPGAQDAVLEAIPERDRGPHLVMALMGLRPGEVRALDAADYSGGMLSVSKAVKGLGPSAPIGPTKNRRARKLPVPDRVAEWIAAHVPPTARLEGRPLFVNARTGRRYSHWALRERWVLACKAVGVEVGMYEGTKHSFATDALERTGDERAVQEVLGHRDARSTQLYAKLRPGAKLDVIRGRRRT